MQGSRCKCQNECSGQGHGSGSSRPRQPSLTEILAEGLPLHGGVQLAIDTTLVSTLHCDGSARLGAAQIDGAVFAEARRHKERTYPELVGLPRRTRVVVLAGEVAGRWSDETCGFLSLLAKTKARGEPRLLRRRAEQA